MVFDCGARPVLADCRRDTLNLDADEFERREVLSVRPGVTGPSQIRWRNGEECYPPGVDTEAYYLAEILPKKLASDLEYT